MITDATCTENISFEELSDYVFSSNRPDNYLTYAAKMNKHIMTCPSCKRNYEALMCLRDETEKLENYEPLDEAIRTRVFALLYSVENSKPVRAIVKECMNFEKWISFNIRSLEEIVQEQSMGFTHPRLATVMKSSVPGQDVEETEGEIKSSLCDRNRNRVSIGLDGTLSLYFDAREHSVGKKVIILPDNTDEMPQMIELTRYDDSISYVRFEGVTPGPYTVVVEE